MKITDEVRAELERIRSKHNGLLKEEHIVDAAREEGSPLHDFFTWDSREAAAKWRLVEAGELIAAVMAEYSLSDGKPIKVRAYVSLPSDRLSGGGYRFVTEVMSDADRKAEFLASLDAELANAQRRCESFRAISVAKGIKRLRRQVQKEARV